MPVDTRIGLQADTLTAAQNIRTLQIQVVNNDGTLQTVQMQVVTIADENGNPIKWLDNRDFSSLMLDELRAIRLGIQEILGQGDPQQPDLIEMAQSIRSDEDA